VLSFSIGLPNSRWIARQVAHDMARGMLYTRGMPHVGVCCITRVTTRHQAYMTWRALLIGMMALL
jgi:hypothetical protein